MSLESPPHTYCKRKNRKNIALVPFVIRIKNTYVASHSLYIECSTVNIDLNIVPSLQYKLRFLHTNYASLLNINIENKSDYIKEL